MNKSSLLFDRGDGGGQREMYGGGEGGGVDIVDVLTQNSQL